MKSHNIHFYFLIATLLLQCQPNEPLDNHTWPEVKSEHKPGTFWWWMGSAVDEKNLKYNLESLADAGIGTVHIVPIYGAKGEEDRYIDFLSTTWMDMLSYTVEEATRFELKDIDLSDADSGKKK